MGSIDSAIRELYPLPDVPQGMMSHTELVQMRWRTLDRFLDGPPESAQLDGLSLNISHIIAVARYGLKTSISGPAREATNAARNGLAGSLSEGTVIYGVNTGVGGSADVRTSDTAALQRAIIRMHHCGLIAPGPREAAARPLEPSLSRHRFKTSDELADSSTWLPLTWTRAAIAIRINSLLKGCSAVRPVVMERMQDLLLHNIIPIIPLRGNISASGDLTPLSYIGGAIQGKTTIRVFADDDHLYADQAFQRASLEPVVLQAKEALAIMNGTATSAASACLALHDTHGLAILSQILTAMSTEALEGTTQNFHPFFGQVRPHPGQIEAARNILAFLDGSSLTKVSCSTEGTLYQDRYSIRTAPQWIGPVLEDLLLADRQLSIEISSVTDNPLAHPDGQFLHGGNFQAKAVTSVAEKCRSGLQALGRMLFAQCTELMNPATSRCLPPNLAAENGGASFTLKSTDINVAALLSELGFLANPVNHVQTAEMGNQSLNSLALISARYTHTAVEVLAQLAAAHLVSVCQALDLRAMIRQYFASVRQPMEALVQSCLLAPSTDAALAQADTATESAAFVQAAWEPLARSFEATFILGVDRRFPAVAESLRGRALDFALAKGFPNPAATATEFARRLAALLLERWSLESEAYIARGSAAPLLGRGTRRMYAFVREGLGVPFLCDARVRTPPPEKMDGAGLTEVPIAPTIGDYIFKVYEAIRDGTMAKVCAETLDAAR